MAKHDENLAVAFDGQAARFERASVQSDPEALARLVGFADLKPASRVLDAGCGPGLVSEAFLTRGHHLFGVNLSAEMVARASARCARFSDRARFAQVSVFDPSLDDLEPFDAAVSRFVLHHVVDPRGFLARQFALLKPGGVLVLCDHTTDPDPILAERHNRIERLRDSTHTTNLTTGSIAELFAAVGLVDVKVSEERFALDFDEWFDRGTPTLPKPEVRVLLLEQPTGRGFSAVAQDDGAIRIECVRALVRGLKEHRPRSSR